MAGGGGSGLRVSPVSSGDVKDGSVRGWGAPASSSCPPSGAWGVRRAPGRAVPAGGRRRFLRKAGTAAGVRPCPPRNEGKPERRGARGVCVCVCGVTPLVGWGHGDCPQGPLFPTEGNKAPLTGRILARPAEKP